MLFNNISMCFLMLYRAKVSIFTFGVDNVYQNFFLTPYQEILPDILLKLTAYFTSYVELVAGFLVVIGLFRDYALYALAIVLVMVSFGHGLAEPIWDLSHVLYRLILLCTLLLLPKQWDEFSFDFYLNRFRKR